MWQKASACIFIFLLAGSKMACKGNGEPFETVMDSESTGADKGTVDTSNDPDADRSSDSGGIDGERDSDSAVDTERDSESDSRDSESETVAPMDSESDSTDSETDTTRPPDSDSDSDTLWDTDDIDSDTASDTITDTSSDRSTAPDTGGDETDRDSGLDTHSETDSPIDTDSDSEVIPYRTECPFTETAEPSGADWVNGELIEFNDDGTWMWFSDERVIVDTDTNQMLIASIAQNGTNSGSAQVTHWNIGTGQGQNHLLMKMAYTDPYDVPAIAKRPEGGYVAMWAGHNDDCFSYHSTFDGASWSAPDSFDWGARCADDVRGGVTMANLWRIGDTFFSFVRSIERSPWFLLSEDGGETFALGGRLHLPVNSNLYAGYYKYWGNNTNRIDWLGTEGAPQDDNISLWHGYLQDGKIFNSYGEIVDDNAFDDKADTIDAYTRVFATGTTVNDVPLDHLSVTDVIRYRDGIIAAIATGRVRNSDTQDPDKRFIYLRFDGADWRATYLASAGTRLYDSEPDETGLGALDPDNPEVIYISTPYDPRTDEGDFRGRKEVWKGVTCNNGETFNWLPLTANSTQNNFRIVAPEWETSHAAVLWLLGNPYSISSSDFKIVGLIKTFD